MNDLFNLRERLKPGMIGIGPEGDPSGMAGKKFTLVVQDTSIERANVWFAQFDGSNDTVRVCFNPFTMTEEQFQSLFPIELQPKPVIQ